MALRINLLDWRAERRERRRIQFFWLLGAAAGAAVLTGGGGWWFAESAVAGQQARNAYLKQQIVEIDQKIKEIQDIERTRENLLARMRVIESLQANRTASVHFFDEIVNTLPEGVNLTALKQQGSQVTLEGIADSNGRVSAYLKNLDASLWFEDPRLIVIRTTDAGQRRASEFTLQVKARNQPKPASGVSGELEEEAVE